MICMINKFNTVIILTIIIVSSQVRNVTNAGEITLLTQPMCLTVYLSTELQV